MPTSRATLAAALAAMSDAVFISDARGKFVKFNDAFATFHRFRNRNECLTSLDKYPKILDVYFSDGRLAPLNMWAVPRALRGECRVNEIYRLRRKDTGERWVGSYSFGPIRDRRGRIIGSVVTGRDITEQDEAQKQLRLYQQDLRSLTNEIMLLEERERRRLAVDLHDGLSQLLNLSRMKVESLRRNGSPTREGLNELATLLDEALRQAGTLVFELSPPVLYELGFSAACEWLADEMKRRYGLKVEMANDGRVEVLEERAATVMFRATRELLINVAKHAAASQARLAVRAARGVVKVEVSDDGVGFDPGCSPAQVLGEAGRGGFGLFSIRERLQHLGGAMQIASRPGAGTRVKLTLPLRASGSDGD